MLRGKMPNTSTGQTVSAGWTVDNFI